MLGVPSVSLLLLLRSSFLSPSAQWSASVFVSALPTCCQLMKRQRLFSRFLPAFLTSAAPGVCLLPLDLISASHRPDLSQFSAVQLHWPLVCPWPSAATSLPTHVSSLYSLLLISKLKTSHCLTLPSLSHASSEASSQKPPKLSQLYYSNNNNNYNLF